MVEPLDLSSPLIVGKLSFTLCSLSEADLAEVMAIEQRSHVHPWSAEDFASSLSSHCCVGLYHDGHCIGYAVLSFVVGEAELLLFVIDAPWRGRGVAKAFLQRVLDAAQTRASCVFLEVRVQNFTAIGLYESLGFNQVGVRPNYYPGKSGRREDALLYALELSSFG